MLQIFFFQRDKNCKNLFIKPNYDNNTIIGLKDSGISVNKFDLSNLNLEDISTNPDFKSDFIDCQNLNSRSLENLNRNSLIYSFINKQSQRQYIGSSINPESRLHTYLFAAHAHIPFPQIKEKGDGWGEGENIVRGFQKKL